MPLECGALTLEKLEAIDLWFARSGWIMIAIPGDTPATTISGIIADEAAIGMVNQKNDGRAHHSRSGQNGRGYGRVRRTFGLCSRDAGQLFRLR